jgi:D-arabinose 1-dehydrogenase-like Zn-dependent alcohol dehydrogenase
VTLPETHVRARLQHAGWDHDLASETSFDVPAPAAGQVRVRVEACGVCHRDLIDRAGRFPFMQMPVTPGHEAVGRVVAVGDGVTTWREGDRVATMHRDSCGLCDACKRSETSLCQGAAWVFGLVADGGYSTDLVAPASAFYRADEAMSAPEAAVFHCTFGTAYRDLVTLGHLRAGERVIVTGANGGVGTAAIGIAKRLGAHAVAVTRSESHRELLTKLGAAEVIVDATGAFHKKVEPADLVLEAVGFATFNASMRSLKIGGRMVVVGNIDPARPELNLGYLITHGITITGGSGATPREMDALLAMHAKEPFTIPIARTLPMKAADEAQRAVRTGGLEGRIVLVA